MSASGCTHCGLCLESCPTYTLWGSEPDSPRGRIVLMEEALDRTGPLTAAVTGHLDACLGCMACVTACPVGVRYDQLVLDARVTIEHQRPLSERLRRRAALEARARAGRVRALTRTQRIPHYTPARGPARARVGLLLGCTQRAAYAAIQAATVGVLAAEGYEVIAPVLPDCCGANDLHSGERAAGRRRAQATIEAFAAVGGIDHVVVAAGICGSMMKRY
ncbi:MAG TPA: (Fe-S)-binding protein, partial [Solirubrobacteraceae bacterium]|nr:(Fe-S)-binding protein [Solirubrobacteraceae bacterium]